MYSMNIGGVELQFLPALDSVSISGGGRPINERTTLDGRIIATRAPLPLPRRLQITAPAGFAISATDAESIRALEGSSGFSITLNGYEPSGTFSGCVFEEPPSFPVTSNPNFRGYSFTLYIPQGAS